MITGVVSRDEFARNVMDELRAALDANELTEDQLRAIVEILKPAAERARLRLEHGGPSDAQIEQN